jgi:predicted Zn-dependent peptidase
VAVRAYVRAGSRYDYDGSPHAQEGQAHLLEHLLFKGTTGRSQQEIFATIEGRGGALQAGTTKETVNVSAVLLPQDLPLALDVVAEVLISPLLDEDAFWNEKLVVLQEIQQSRDQQSILIDTFCETLWQAHPLRHNILGGLGGLQAMDHATLCAFHKQRYVAGNMLLVICGNIDHGRAQALAAASFGALPAGPEQPPPPAPEPPLTALRTTHLTKDTRQTHLLIGLPTMSMKDPDRSALKVIERVLGMGGSGRLHQRLREDQQLVYSSATATATYEDAGFLLVQTACAPENVEQVVDAILAEWDELRRNGVNDAELARAQGNYSGTLAQHFETNRALAGIFALEGLLHQVETLQEAVARVGAVSRADVVRVARAYLDPQRYASVTVGREV